MGEQKGRFLTFSGLNNEYLRNETSHRQPGKDTGDYKSPHTVSKLHELWPTTAKMGPSFLLTFRKFCILHHCQASHTEVSKQNFVNYWEVNRICKCMSNIWTVHSPPQNWGAKKTASFVMVLTSSRQNYARWRKIGQEFLLTLAMITVPTEQGGAA